MEQNSITVKNVTKKFNDFMLDHISFQVPTGCIVGFIGEKWCRKKYNDQFDFRPAAVG